MSRYNSYQQRQTATVLCMCNSTSSTHVRLHSRVPSSLVSLFCRADHLKVRPLPVGHLINAHSLSRSMHDQESLRGRWRALRNWDAAVVFDTHALERPPARLDHPPSSCPACLGTPSASHATLPPDVRWPVLSPLPSPRHARACRKRSPDAD